MADVILLVGAGVLILLLAYLVYAGMFVKVVVGTGRPPIGEVTLAYKFGKGPYRGVGKICSSVCKLDTKGKHKILCIYYDDPKVVPSQELRYLGGAILSEDGKEQDEDFKRKLQDEGFKTFKLPAISSAVNTTFPYKGFISIYLAILKVYPAIGAYTKEHHLRAHPCLEICDGNTMHYMSPLVSQDEFYVEEAESKKT